MGEKSKKDQRCLPAAGGSGPVPRVCLHSLGRLLLSTARHKQFGLWRCAVCPCSNRSVPAHVFTRHVPDSLSARGTAANIALKDNERHSLHLVQGPSTRTVELFSTVRSCLVLLPTQVAGNAKKGDRGEEFFETTKGCRPLGSRGRWQRAWPSQPSSCAVCEHTRQRLGLECLQLVLTAHTRTECAGAPPKGCECIGKSRAQALIKKNTKVAMHHVHGACMARHANALRHPLTRRTDGYRVFDTGQGRRAAW